MVVVVDDFYVGDYEVDCGYYGVDVVVWIFEWCFGDDVDFGFDFGVDEFGGFDVVVFGVGYVVVDEVEDWCVYVYLFYFGVGG